MERITKNEIEYHGKHIRSLCHAGDVHGCTALFCDGCVILKMYRTLAALGDYAEKIESIVSLGDVSDIKDYIKRFDAVIRRHQFMTPCTKDLDEQDVIKCPNCGYGLRAVDDPLDSEPNFCLECGQKLRWTKTGGNSTDTGIHASRFPALRLETDKLEALASNLLSEYLGREIKAYDCGDDYEQPDYWGLRVDETPLSKDDIERLKLAFEADADAWDSTDFGEYPIVEISQGVAEALISQALPIDVDHSIGSKYGVWFFGKSELIKVADKPEQPEHGRFDI